MKMLNWLPKMILLLVLPCTFLVVLGVVMLINLAPNIVNIQIAAALIAVGFFLIISKIDYHIWRDIGWVWYAICMGFLLLTLVLGTVTRGTNSWLILGPISIQPSEFVRPFVIIFLAQVASVLDEVAWLRLLKQGVFFAIPSVILFLQPDLGSVILLGMGWLGILVAQKLPVKLWMLGLGLVIVTLPVGWSLMHDYQRDRIRTFISPEADPLGTGYNVIQSKVAIGSGQLMGRGLGRGTQSHLHFLPEFHTDFMFASIAEELGLVGGMLVIGLYGCLFAGFVRVIYSCEDSYGRLAAAGLFTSLFGQVIINIGMNQGIMPVTGITLPLLSYGGSSLVATAIFLGLMNSIATKRRNTQYLHIH